MEWTTSDIPTQTGKIAVVTGASAGIGRETTRILASKGAEVVMAVRNVSKGNNVAEHIQKELPDAILKVLELDLSSLTSVRSFAASFNSNFNQLDLLINNAGIYTGAKEGITTEDGFALMMGVNHLGHFALTGLLLDSLLKTPASRIVTVSSGAHRGGKIDVDNFHTVKAAQRGAYGNSKLANMLFTLELQRKLTAIGANTISVSAGPGPTKSDGAKQGIQSIPNPILRRLAESLTNRLMATAEMGASTLLRAATEPNVKGSDYFGPSGFMGMRGYPAVTKPAKSADDETLAQGLWVRSTELTGVQYTALLDT